MTFRKLLNLFESLEQEQLDEALGPLANLKAGNLINVFKQGSGHRGSASPDASKFTNAWGGGVGQNSEQINIGKISSWKDLRKAVGRNNDKRVIGAVFYVDGTAFAALNMGSTHSSLYKPSEDAIIAFDPAKLPARDETPPEGLTGYELRQWEAERRLPAASAQSRKGWDDIPKKYTGIGVSVGSLHRYVDDIIEKFPEHEFTCVALTIDKVGTEKQRERRTAAQTNDELSRREEEQKGYYRNQSLNVALDKYKASKNFNSFNEPEELIDYLSDQTNYGQEFVYKNNRYINRVPADEKLSVRLESLMFGKPIEFSVPYRRASKDSYSSVYVTYRLENGVATPIKVDR